MKYVQSKKEKKYLNPIPIKLFIFPKVYIKKKLTKRDIGSSVSLSFSIELSFVALVEMNFQFSRHFLFLVCF